ncbi:hypothetical protein [Kibdelosporangium phytohabitans]|nr:hypothetical protein [Kibdelosporangium phytohabitans]MBE1471363.1 hypothetical protein [Kibdelosporangium phytohabitans]
MADGQALIDGIGYEATAGPLPKTASANGNTNPRIDRFILKLDAGTPNSIVATIKQGTPAASPTPPSLTVDPAAGVVEVPLARATCPGSGSAQNYHSLVDERMFVGSAVVVGGAPDPGAWHQFRAGDLLYTPDTRLMVWDGSALKGVRSDQYAGVIPAGESGTESVTGGNEATYASITVPNLGYPYKISFAAHLHMAGLVAGGYVQGFIRQDGETAGTILASGSEVCDASNLDTPLSLPTTKPVTIAAGAAHTWWFRVKPSTTSSFVWGTTDNWFSAQLTPVW